MGSDGPSALIISHEQLVQDCPAEECGFGGRRVWICGSHGVDTLRYSKEDAVSSKSDEAPLAIETAAAVQVAVGSDLPW